jgi:radical SAM protein with 4Fe4S-binding SPASM domain
MNQIVPCRTEIVAESSIDLSTVEDNTDIAQRAVMEFLRPEEQQSYSNCRDCESVEGCPA